MRPDNSKHTQLFTSYKPLCFQLPLSSSYRAAAASILSFPFRPITIDQNALIRRLRPFTVLGERANGTNGGKNAKQITGINTCNKRKH